MSKYRVATITDAVVTKYPALATWGEALGGRVLNWADLMFFESAVMFGAMLNLMHIQDTPSLSVHDSLIVPVSKAEIAEEAIKWTFHAKHRVEPLLKINLPPNKAMMQGSTEIQEKTVGEPRGARTGD